jgi:hypothetical protein
MSSRVLLVLILVPLSLALMACGEGGSVTDPTPAQTTFPPPPPTGTFAIMSSNPVLGGSVTGRESDLQGTAGLTVTFQMTYAQSLSEMYFVVGLFNGSVECLRSQIAYSRRLDSSPAQAYAAGTTAVYRSEFFVRDNQQPGCGAGFTTNRIRFTLQDRTQIDPGTRQLRTLYWEEVSGGWTFAFAR